MNEMKKECLRCRDCTIGGCYEGRNISNVWSRGSETAEIMIVGLNPSLDEVIAGEPFQGSHGQYLERVLSEELGLDSSKIYMTNLVKCFIRDNRRPTKYEVSHCSSSFLKREIELVKPKIILSLGKTVLDHLCNVRSINRHRGQEMVSAKYKVRIMPTFAPGKAVINNPISDKLFRSDIAQLKDYING